ncbi:MAG TPA: hypothetical protein VE218_04140 [Acidobacteriaceae bacterium]|nr:hypothetical protein [Acidobacteriaceae bacterium]
MAFLLMVTASSIAQAPPQPPQPPPIAADRASDSYAIYSLLISGSSQGQRIAIADTTININDTHSATGPENEVQPPPGSESAFEEAVENFQSHREERVQLQRQLKLEEPYQLLSEAQVETYQKHPTGYASVTLFSEVYFNTTQTAALVFTYSLCNSPCGKGRWIYLEKLNGQWIRRYGSTVDREDTYAIYSLLLHDDPYPGLPQQQGTLAIADTTVNITDMSPAIAPNAQLRPPPNQSGFLEAAGDYWARRFERRHLVRNFHLDGDYTLLSAEEVASYKQSQTGYPAINFFSAVYFDTQKKAALVYRSVFCGHLCANGQWIYLEKQGNQWVRRSGLNI